MYNYHETILINVHIFDSLRVLVPSASYSNNNQSRARCLSVIARDVPT